MQNDRKRRERSEPMAVLAHGILQQNSGD